jgi:hypothetical protein
MYRLIDNKLVNLPNILYINMERNVYYPNFIGETNFKQNYPYAQSTLSRFKKKRIGEE